MARESVEKLRLWLRQLLLQWPGDTQTGGNGDGFRLNL